MTRESRLRKIDYIAHSSVEGIFSNFKRVMSIPKSKRRKTWRDGEFEARQQPVYESRAELSAVTSKLKSLPPLVSLQEINRLRSLLASAERNDAFVIQGGDCAETFEQSAEEIFSKIKILLQMSFVITMRAKKKTVRIGRIAGQFSKPRSSQFEEDGVTPTFKGENVNSFTTENRKPDPWRLLQGHFHSACTLNYIRTCLDSDFLGDLRRADEWTKDFDDLYDREERKVYSKIVSSIRDSMSFLRNVGTDVVDEAAFKRADFFTSHEALILELEDALVRGSDDKYFYNSGAHFLWIGNRTRFLNSAHVEHLRGLENPVGIKVDSKTDVEELFQIIHKLNPKNEQGKIVIITRFGAKFEKLEEKIEEMVVRFRDMNLLYMCDPMHGNTIKTGKLKSRIFEDVEMELRRVVGALKNAGSFLGGIHLELTGLTDVTECIGGPHNLTREDLPRHNTTYCDPRLNAAQALDLSFKIADSLLHQK